MEFHLSLGLPSIQVEWPLSRENLKLLVRDRQVCSPHHEIVVWIFLIQYWLNSINISANTGTAMLSSV